MTAFTEETAIERKEEKKFRDLLRQNKMAIDAAVRNLFKSPEGRQYISFLLDSAMLGNNPFSDTDRGTAFNCGMQFHGQMLLNHILEVAPEQYANLVKEKYSGPGNYTSRSQSEPEPEPDAEPRAGSGTESHFYD